MRLIDADMNVHWQTYDDEHETFPEHTGTIAEFLDSMTDEGCPEAVDAVPVVRCKDCKHHHYEKHFDKRIPYCDRINYGYGWQDDDFCSYGERKDGEQHE